MGRNKSETNRLTNRPTDRPTDPSLCMRARGLIIVRRQSLAMGTQERGDAAVVKYSGRRRGGGSHSVSFTVGGHEEER